MIEKSDISAPGAQPLSGTPGAAPIPAARAELSVYIPGGVRSAVQGAAAAFELKTGHKIRFTYGTGGGIQKQIAGGAPADVTVLPSKGISELDKQGLTAPDSRMEVGTVGVGVGIQAGAPRPRIGTPDEFRETLLAAKTVTYADPARGATSGAYFESVVLPRLGIVEQVKGKTFLTAVGEECVHRVADGKSEIVVVQSSEIVAVPGAELVGPLPESLQNAIPYAAVVLKSSKAQEAARAFVAFLDSPAGRAAFRKAGFENVPKKAFQDYYPDFLSHCYGCGRLNAAGHQIKSYWDGEESVCIYEPETCYTAIPGFVYGGMIASLIDCHSTGTAAAAKYRSEGREMDTDPPLRFLTGSLHVDYLLPTPQGVPLEIRGTVKEVKGRKVVVTSTLSANGKICARGEVVAVQVPEHLITGLLENRGQSQNMQGSS